MLIVKYIDFNFFLAYNKDVEKKGEKYGCNIFKTWNCSFYRYCWSIYLFQCFDKRDQKLKIHYDGWNRKFLLEQK